MEVKLLGLTSKEYIEKQINICAAAGKLSRMPGTVFDALDNMKDPEAALKFISRVIGMGHASTIDHDYMVFALSEVTPVVEQIIIAERFSSFTIKSRREVDFSKVGFLTPDFHDKNGNILKNNEEIQAKYKKHMSSLFDAYQKFIDGGINKEDSRFVLPYCYHSEIIMGLDGTSLTRMIVNLTKTKYSKISELRLLGEKLYEIALERAPYIKVLVEKEEMNLSSGVEDILNELGFQKKYELLESPVLLSYTEDPDKTLFTNAISRLYSMQSKDAVKFYENKISQDDTLKERLMKEIFNEVNHEDLRQINFRFQHSIPYAILTHYTRHRRLSLSIPEFFPVNELSKYITPPSIKSNEKLNELFVDVYKNNLKMYEEFKNMEIRDEDLVYFTLSGNTINVIINFDGEAFRWICRLRECTKAQWCIRKAVTQMHELVSEVSTYYSKNLGPDCVTKHYCGEGKESCGRLKVILESIKKVGV